MLACQASLFSKVDSQPRTSQPDETHNRADTGKQNEDIEESQHSENQTVIFRQETKTKHDELQVKQNQANRCEREPSGGSAEGPSPRKTKHRRY